MSGNVPRPKGEGAAKRRVRGPLRRILCYGTPHRPSATLSLRARDRPQMLSLIQSFKSAFLILNYEFLFRASTMLFQFGQCLSDSKLQECFSDLEDELLIQGQFGPVISNTQNF